MRVVTRALSAAPSSAAAAATAAALERLCLANGISFLNLGDTSDEALLEDDVFARIAAVTDYTSCAFRRGGGRRGCAGLACHAWHRVCPTAAACRLTLGVHPSPPCSWRPGMGQQQAQRLAAAIHGLAERKPGAPFRFGVGFNCQGRGIPYFPVAAAPAVGGAEGGADGFAIGTENSGLLHRAFQQAAATVAAVPGTPVLDAAQAALRLTMAEALQPLEALARRLEADSGVAYLGIDASIAPALEPPSIPAAYELLGLGRFGGAGTLAISGAGRSCA